MSNELNEITERSGQYKVTTEHGTHYIFDFTGDIWKAKRVPAQGRNELRADNDWFRLRGFDLIKVGNPIEMNVLGLRNDDWYTWRATTDVTKIEKIEN